MNFLSPEMLGLIAPALLAGLTVCAMHVPLGLDVLRRGIIFIDLAIAQIAALGVVFGKIAFHVDSGPWPFVLALAFALGGSALFALLGRKAPEHQEAFIGCAFVLAASIILLLLAKDPHGGEEIENLLAGQILWAGWKQAGLTAIIYAGCLFLWFCLPRKRPALFYILFPIVITLSVQMVGVYLVFATLIIPALGAQAFCEKHRLTAAYTIAITATVSGLALSTLADLPAGPAIVCTFAGVAIIAALLREINRARFD